MNPEEKSYALQLPMSVVKTWLSLIAGGCLTLLALAISNKPDEGILRSGHWNWYLVWLMLQLVALPLAGVFVFSKSWRELAWQERVNSLFSYLAVEWLFVAALFIKLQSDEGDWLFVGLSGLLLLAGFIGLGLALALSYWWLRRSKSDLPEEMFP